MSTTQEIDSINKLGIIAGGGNLPAYLLSVCKEKGITAYIVALKDQCSTELIEDHPEKQTLWTELGTAGKIIDYFHDNNVTDLVLIGSVKRPTFSQLKLDVKGMQIISQIGLNAMGDNGLLKAVRKILEKEGFAVRALQDFCDELLMPHGTLGKFAPEKSDKANINLGIRTSQKIGAMDIGQSVIVQDSSVIGVEDIEGTDALIKQCASLLKPDIDGGILIKTCKPQQDMALDLPTIGVDTIQNAYNAGIKGIVLHAGHTFLVDPKNIAEYANKYKMFIIGIDIPITSE